MEDEEQVLPVAEVNHPVLPRPCPTIVNPFPSRDPTRLARGRGCHHGRCLMSPRLPRFPAWLAALLCLAGISRAQAQIDTALGVRSLTAEQAKEGLAVKLRAVVGFIEAPGTVFLQDQTAGTFFRTKAVLGDLQEGDVVEVQGKTFPGLYLPGIEAQSFQVLSHGTPPPARAATFDDLASGRFHYQRVSISGIVRSVAALDENRSLLRLAMGSRVVEVRVDRPPAYDESLVDADITVSGLAAGAINDLRQLVQPYLRVGGWQELAVVKAGRPGADAPQIVAGSLLRFSTTGLSWHRVRVSGQVLAAFANGQLFVRDDSGALGIRLAVPQQLSPGEHIEVLGFPEMERFSAILEDASLLSRDPGDPPSPVPVTMKEMQRGVHDSDLVTLAGTVTDVFRTADGEAVMLHVDDRIVRAALIGEDHLPSAIGSRVQVTGVCRVESVIGKGFNSRPNAISLLLRSANDVRVLSSPSWWTVERLLTALGLLALVILMGAVWIVLLRRQVSRQTDALRGRIQREAALEERQRIAREFHDTLEQELAGLSLRMDAAATRPLEDKARSLLTASRSLVSRIQAEARNLVADLRDDSAAVGDLVTALQDLTQHHPAEAPILRVEVQGVCPTLSPHVVHHLRMIAREAMTNALKHARAAHITIRLQGLDGRLNLEITDDGTGFDPQSETRGKAGHFGCMGIRERCQKIGAEVRWQSEPGRGTVVTVEL
jgi:signal transduction histidine kinase